MENLREMASDRSPREVIVDRLLLMHLIDRANKKKDLYGMTKLQKLVFLTEYSMVKEGIKGFNYGFYKWHFGPFSREIYEDLDRLVSNEIATERMRIELTDRGREILEECAEIFEENKQAMKCLDRVLEKHADKPTHGLMELTYNIPIEYPLFKGFPKKIKEIPEGWDLISKLDEDLAKTMFNLSDEWMETLDTILNKEAYNSLKEAMKSARTERSYTHAETFPSV